MRNTCPRCGRDYPFGDPRSVVPGRQCFECDEDARRFRVPVTKYYRVKVYVGPVSVQHYAAQAKAAGFTDVFDGTEHVYGTVSSPPLENESDRQCLAQRVADTVYGCPMAAGWRDVTILGAA